MSFIPWKKENQNLIVLNGHKKCKGTITRQRTTNERVEKSAIDIVLVSDDLEQQAELS